MSQRIYHGTCGRWWTGANLGHCSGCHEVFTGDAFDLHQRISDGKVTCLDPATALHVDGGRRAGQPVFRRIEKPWGVLWGKAMTESRLKSLDVLAKQRLGAQESTTDMGAA